MSKIAKFKINIIEYYENLKNKIDIKTQTQLVNESLLDKEREELLRISNSFIEKCEETLKKTMNEIDEVAEESDPLIDQFTDKHIPNLFSSHCMLIENSILPLKNSIGLLVVSDWSMNTNEIQFTNKLFSMGDNSILEVIDERDLIQPLDNKQSMESFILTGNLFLIKYAYDCSRINKRYRNQNIFLNKHLADTIELFRQKLIADLGKTRKFHLSGFKFSLVEKDAFHFLVNLSELSLWGNQISVLTSNLFNNNLCNLIKLELFSCGIKKIESDAFAGLVHLEHLNLGHNPQIDLHCCSQFNGLKNLRYLNLSDSDFKLDINDLAIFKNFTKLVHLDIALSSLRKHIKKYLFTGLDQLEKLDLSHCMITSIESESFKCVTNLKELDLKFNYIMEIDSTTFKCLVNLEKLDLKDCSITKIKNDSFYQQKKLKNLNIEQNKIECLEENAFIGLENLEELIVTYTLDIKTDFFQNLAGLKSIIFSVDPTVLPPRNPMDIKRLFNLPAELVIEFRGVL